MKWFLRVLVALTAFLSASFYADTIKLAADEWMPFNGDGKTETGYMIDIAKIVFEKAGYTLSYEVTPWARAIEETRGGNYDAIIGAYKSDAPDFIFPENEQGFGGNTFFVKKGSKWKFNGIKSLEGIKIGVIQDYAYSDDLDKYIKLNQKDKTKIDFSFGTKPAENNIKKLIAGQVDAIVDDMNVVKFAANKLNVFDLIELAGSAGEPDNMYIAFSPKNPKSKDYAAILSKGISELRKSGELKKILAKYGLKDWK